MHHAVLPRCVSALLIAGAVACGDAAAPAAPAAITLSDSAAAALPTYYVTDGARLCEADGRTLCPVRNAFAARLDARRVALWQAGGLAAWFTLGDSTLTQIGQFKSAEADGYQTVTGIAADGDGFRVFEASFEGYRLLTFSATGELESAVAPALPEGTTTLGFVGNVPLMQVVRGRGDSVPARLQLIRLRDAGDSVGTVVLDAPIPWMRAIGTQIRAVPPLFAAAPVFTFDPALGMVWSPGDTGRIERRDERGRVLWTVSGLTGPAVDSGDVAARRRELDRSLAMPLTDEEFDRMSARVADRHGAISGLLFGPGAQVLVARSVVPVRDSVEWLRLAADGTPIGQVRLHKAVRVLLDEGDSLLVHRPTEGETTEVRWIRLALPSTAPAN